MEKLCERLRWPTLINLQDTHLTFQTMSNTPCTTNVRLRTQTLPLPSNTSKNFNKTKKNISKTNKTNY